MSRFILDASVALSWCFEGETSDYADEILESLHEHQAVVPSLWELEISNAIVMAERQDRLTVQESTRFLRLLENLPILKMEWTPQRFIHEILHLARDYSISGYDAVYLWLSMEEGLSLATVDNALKNASKTCGIQVFDG